MVSLLDAGNVVVVAAAVVVVMVMMVSGAYLY